MDSNSAAAAVCNGAEDLDEAIRDDTVQQITKWIWIVTILVLPIVIVTLPATALFCIYSVSRLKSTCQNCLRNSSWAQFRWTPDRANDLKCDLKVD